MSPIIAPGTVRTGELDHEVDPGACLPHHTCLAIDVASRQDVVTQYSIKLAYKVLRAVARHHSCRYVCLVTKAIIVNAP